MAPFFSYKTFSSLSVELIDRILYCTMVWFSNRVGALVNKGTQSCDGFAQNEVLHLICAFVIEKHFSVCEVSPDVVIDGNTVAAKDLPSPRHSFATLGGRKSLGERCLSVCHLALVIQLCHSTHQALTGSYVRDHFSEKILYELK